MPISRNFQSKQPKTNHMTNYLLSLQSAFPNLKLDTNVDLAPFTQVKLGGPAEVFFETQSIEDFTQVVQFCQKSAIPVTILGWGANTLIADRGIKGLVIRNRTKGVDYEPKLPTAIAQYQSQVNHSQSLDIRFSQIPASQTYTDLEYNESHLPVSPLVVDSGAPLPWVISTTLEHGLTGLQWFARIPATLGGAVVNNIHGGKHFLSELILGVELVDELGQIQVMPADHLEFGYDASIFHQQKWVITRVYLQLYQGNVVQAKQVVTAWSIQKKHQPQRSLGCIFQNLDTTTQHQLNLPTPSVGYFLDQFLHLKGFKLGQAMISPQHAAFIQSEPGCSSAEYLELIKVCVNQAKQHGVKLQPEIFFKGFTTEELSDIIIDT